MKESVLRDLLNGNLAKLVAGGLQGVYSDPFTVRVLRPEMHYAVQAPVVLSQLRPARRRNHPAQGGEFRRGPGLPHPGRGGGLPRIPLSAAEPGFQVRRLRAMPVRKEGVIRDQ
jgi:hypothetical protein